MTLNAFFARLVTWLDDAYCWSFCGCKRRSRRDWSESRWR
jgi:hypothetical protein